jgi:hypothetical protein
VRYFKSIAVLIFLFLFYSCATNIATLDQQKSLERIKDLPGLTKKEIYDKSISYVARAFNSANDVIQLKDPDNGQIVCKCLGSRVFDFGITRYFRYTMIVDIKDGKIRVNYENLQSERMSDVVGPDMSYQWTQVSEYLDNLSNDLFKSIVDNNKKTDW